MPSYINSLFPTPSPFPPGFIYTPGFITPGEEQELLAIIKTLDLKPMNFLGFEAKRRVASFGYDYSFENRKVTRGKDIPQEFLPLISRVASNAGVDQNSFAELLITGYPPGAVINWHRDAFPFELIAGISLLSDCIFRLRPHEKSKQSRQAILSAPVSRRSLYIIKDDARYLWQHSIAPVKTLRYSITLRTLKGIHNGN
jgi:alkylated DNA repair dioxygenase AlkB